MTLWEGAPCCFGSDYQHAESYISSHVWQLDFHPLRPRQLGQVPLDLPNVFISCIVPLWKFNLYTLNTNTYPGDLINVPNMFTPWQGLLTNVTSPLYPWWDTERWVKWEVYRNTLQVPFKVTNLHHHHPPSSTCEHWLLSIEWVAIPMGNPMFTSFIYFITQWVNSLCILSKRAPALWRPICISVTTHPHPFPNPSKFNSHGSRLVVLLPKSKKASAYSRPGSVYLP